MKWLWFVVLAGNVWADEAWVLTNRQFQLHLLQRGTNVVAAFATGYNSRPHDMDLTGVTFDGKQWRGDGKLTLNADDYVPASNAVIRLDEMVGTHQPQPASTTYHRLKLRIPGALRRLYNARGANWKYALDMDLLVTFRDGKPLYPRLETPVPDYRRYDATVNRCDLKYDGHLLRGVVEALVDTGGQGKVQNEVHRFDLDLVVIGDKAAGTCDIVVGETKVAGQKLQGAISREPPPLPVNSQATLRWGKVLLNLSLGDAIHGLAWVPAENHQPHDVDASQLVLTNNTLTGPVKVTVVPDVYRKEVSFSFTCRLDAKFDGADIAGTYVRDEEQGTLTGELRARTPPVVRNVGELKSAEIGLGYCLVGGPPPHVKDAEAGQHASVLVDYATGKVTVINPKSREPLPAKEPKADLKITGDHLTGEVAFRLGGGQYVFRLNATINGGRFGGYWRGTFDGAPVLTKSSKLGGQLTAK